MAQKQPQQPKPSTRQNKKPSATHTAIAREYTSRHWQDTAFLRSAWYRYFNGVWLDQHDLTLEHDVWNLLEEYEQGKRCRPSASILNSVLKRLKARFFILDDQVDYASSLINLTNGVYSLEDKRLHPHKTDYYFTTQLPFDYDPDAAAPLWEDYVNTTFVHPRTTNHDPEVAAFVQEAVGYSLTTSIDYEVSFWCLGRGANGKGVLLHILGALSGDSAVPLNIPQLKRGVEYQLAGLAGKRIAMCSEVAAHDNLIEDAIIKALISGDTMSVRQIHRAPFTLYPMAKLWWTMNELPSVADTSEGFWRRCRVIPFNHHFELGKDRILGLKQKLEPELPGIFNWAMRGLERLEQQGDFTMPAQVRKATAQYRMESNPVALFIDENYAPSASGTVQSSVIYQEYKDWCKDTLHRAKSTPKFKKEMERLGYPHKRTKVHATYQGLVKVTWP